MCRNRRPIRHRLFGGLAGAPSNARRGRADSRSPGGQAKRAGVRDGSPKGRDAIGGSMRSTTARPGIAGGRTEIRGTCNASLLKTSEARNHLTHLRKPTEPYFRKSGFTYMPKHRFTHLRQIVPTQSRQSVKPVKRQKARNRRWAIHVLLFVKRPAARQGVRATFSRPCCATRSGCVCRPRLRPVGRRWSPGTTDHPGLPTGRAAVPPC